MCQISFQQLLYCFRRLLGLDVMIDRLAQISIWPEPATSEQVITFDGLVLLTNSNFRRYQPDIADVMLSAGMMAAGEMDVERRVDRHPGLAPVRDLPGVAFGVGGCKLAASIPGTCDQPCADLRRLYRKADRFNGGDGYSNVFVAHAGYQQVLPDRQPDISIAKIVCDLRQSAHLVTAHLTELQRHPDPVQTRLLLLVNADMRGAVES